MMKLLGLGVVAAFAALSVVGMTAAHAQSATSCPGGSDATASDCLQIFNPDGSQLSLLAITESDELADPGRMWSIGGVVPTNRDLIGMWVEVIEPGTGAISDIVGVPTSDEIAFISDPADFTGFTIFRSVTETSGKIDVSDLLDPGAFADGFRASFQSDLEAAVPEPATWAMLILGFAGLGYAAWRRRPAANARTLSP